MKTEVIRASAGTGKTYRLVEDIAAQMAGGMKPESLIAVTFTEKAAAELKSRLQRRLIERGLFAHSARLESAMIGTVHSVCRRLLVRFAFSAGISPEAQPVPDAYRKTLFRQALVAAQEEVSVEAALAAEERLDLSGSLTGRAADIAERAIVNDIAPEALPGMAEQSLAEMLAWCGPADWRSEAEADRDFADGLDAVIAEMNRTLGGDRTLWQNNEKSYYTKVSGLAERLRRHPERCAWKQFQTIVGESPAAALRELHAELVLPLVTRHVRHPRLHADLREYLHAAFALAAAGMQHYDALKRRKRLIDFNDMERETWRLLQTPTVCESLRGEFSILYVDEFQDTSPLQLALFMELGAVTGHMVWVGDRKQAIYGFRGSDPVLMDAAYRQFSADDGEVLDVSYRSRPELVALFGAVFGPVFGARGYQQSELSLRADRKEQKALPEHAFELWFDASTDASRKKSMREVVGGIHDLLRRGIAVYDRNLKTTRPVSLRDIAVLCRKNRECAALAAELVHAGIPAHARRGGLLDTPEGMFMHSALQLYADTRAIAPRLILARLASGGDIAELLRDIMALHRSAPQDMRDAIRQQPAHPLVERIIAAATHADASPCEALERIIAAADLAALCVAWGDADQRLSNIDVLRDAVVQYQQMETLAGGGATIAGFLAWLDNDTARNASDEMKGMEQGNPAGMDAVSVLTWHQSKGLEWPVVILGNGMDKAEEQPSRDYFTVHTLQEQPVDMRRVLSGRRIALYPWPYDRNTRNTVPLVESFKSTPRYQMLDAIRRGGEERLLYVGFTRAADLLVLAGGKAPKSDDNTGAKKAKKKSSGDDDAAAVYRLGYVCTGFAPERCGTAGAGAIRLGSGLTVPGAIRSFEAHQPQPREAAPVPWFDGAPRMERAPYYRSPSQETHAAAPVSFIPQRLGGRLPFRLRGGDDTDASAFGNCLHAFFQADTAAGDPADRIIRAGALLRRYDQDAANVEPLLEAFSRIERFARTLGPDAALYRELPVQYRSGDQLVRGIADMVVLTAAGFYLIDYKSFPGGEAECLKRCERYAVQLQDYVEGIQRATGLPCAGAYLYYAVEGIIVEVEYPDQCSSTGTHAGG